MKELLFSIRKSNFDIQTFRSGGKGGQNQNKVSSGVRIIHRESGARGEARDSRNQLQNKRNAFKRLTETKIFKAWLKVEIARKTGELKKTEEIINKRVEEWMKPENIKIEFYDGE